MEQKLRFKKRIKQELDELKLQVKLGKAETVDYMEDKKEDFAEFVDDTREKLDDLSEASGKKVKETKQAFDELRLQLELGKMETSDAYHQQKEKIDSAITKAWRRLCAIENAAEDVITALRTSFAHRAGAFGAKLELLALHLGEKQVTKDSVIKQARDDVKAEIQEWADDLDKSGEIATVEVHQKWEDFKNKVRKSVS